MMTDEDKSRLMKLLQDLEVPEDRLPERSLGLVKDFQDKFGYELEEAIGAEAEVEYENPYMPDKDLLEETERKLRVLRSEEKRLNKQLRDDVPNSSDPKRPWRTNSNRERLHRIDCDIKRHLERSTDKIVPLAEGDMQQLVKSFEAETRMAAPVCAERLRETVDEARRNLPNFQYRTVDNTTATAILPEAHYLKGDEETR